MTTSLNIMAREWSFYFARLKRVSVIGIRRQAAIMRRTLYAGFFGGREIPPFTSHKRKPTHILVSLVDNV